MALTDNFRSHEAILRFVNELFPQLMRSAVGGVDYDQAARLRFGAPQSRVWLAWRPEQPIQRESSPALSAQPQPWTAGAAAAPSSSGTAAVTTTSNSSSGPEDEVLKRFMQRPEQE